MTRRNLYISIGAGVVVLLLVMMLLTSSQQGDSIAVLNGGSASSKPSTGPATTTGLLPEQYSLLETRNPFGAGRGKKGGPESAIILKGVISTGEDFLAFFEDTSSKSVLRKKVGESVGRGKIKSMDLDTLVYVSPDGTKTLQVGQNLNGETPPPPPPPATQPAAAPPGGPTPAPAGRGRAGAQPQPPNGPPPGAVMIVN